MGIKWSSGTVCRMTLCPYIWVADNQKSVIFTQVCNSDFTAFINQKGCTYSSISHDCYLRLVLSRGHLSSAILTWGPSKSSSPSPDWLLWPPNVASTWTNKYAFLWCCRVKIRTQKMIQWGLDYRALEYRTFWSLVFQWSKNKMATICSVFQWTWKLENQTFG